MNKLPEEWVSEQLASEKKVTLFGVPLEELSREELLAAAIFASNEYEKRWEATHRIFYGLPKSGDRLALKLVQP